MQDEFNLEQSFKPISFSRSSASEQHYRSTQAIPSSSVSLIADSISAPVTGLQAPKSSALHIPSQAQATRSLSAIDISLSSDYPASKAPARVNVFPDLAPLKMVGMVNTAPVAEPEASLSSASPLSIPPSLASNQRSKFCNELNSCVARDVKPAELMHRLDAMLRDTYGNDIDAKRTDSNQIEGLVFISHFKVFFLLTLWDESPDTRVEFRRTSGDALAAAQLWSSLKQHLSSDGNSGAANMAGQDFICLDMDYNLGGAFPFDSSLDSFPTQQTLSKVELENVTQSLVDNDLFVVDELQYLYESMRAVRGQPQAHTDLCRAVLSQETLMQELINRSLLNKDVCVSRCVLLILRELASVAEHGMDAAEYQLMQNLNLLLNHQRPFIRKSTLHLLSTLLLSSGSGHCTWQMDGLSRQCLIDNVKKCATECNFEDDSFHDVIANITAKLMK